MKITYRNRRTDKIIEEKTPGGGFLNFLYGNNPIGKATLKKIVRKKFLSKWAGKYMNSSKSIKRIQKFIDKQQLDMSDYIIPKEGFESFNAFFYRKVIPAKRPIGKGIVSPADGKILVFQNLDTVDQFFIKGTPFDLKSYFNDKTVANKFKGGSLAIIRLAPIDYHRFHFPISGKVSGSKIIKGHYYSVSPLALRKSLDIFCQNQREYMLISNEEIGTVAYSEVGATMVGTIIQTYKVDTNVLKGEEKGYFAFGGSTVVLFFEKGKIAFDSDLSKNTNNGIETEIKMGEKIAIPIISRTK